MRALFIINFVVAFILMCSNASAQILFTLNSVDLEYRTVSNPILLSGTIETNNSLTQLLAVNIVAQPGPGDSVAHSFPGFTYTLADSSVASMTLTGATPSIRLDTAGQAQELQLAFASSLSTTGTTLLNTIKSYESEHLTSGVRTVQSGVVVVPEPSTGAFILSGAMFPAFLVASAQTVESFLRWASFDRREQRCSTLRLYYCTLSGCRKMN